MPDTPLGLTYPDASGHTRLWEHLQALADDADRAVPRAWLAQRTSTLSSIGTTAVDIVSCSFTAQVGRLYRATLFLPTVVGMSSTNRFLIELMTGTVRLQRAYVETRQAGTSADLSQLVTYVGGPSLSGAQTWRARIAVDGFGTSGSVAASSTSPVQLTVEELVPA